MAKNKKHVTFANRVFEESYRKLAKSKHSEDQKLRKSLSSVREMLAAQFQRGKEVQKNKIPPIYKRMFKINSLWKLNLPRDRTVLYSFDGNNIRIIDIV